MRLVLASTSPRRRALLARLGLPFRAAPPAVDERPRPGEDPAAHVRRLALAKARAVARGARGELVVGADTVVAVDGVILGKPRDARDAARMLARLAGRTHEVLTGVALVIAGTGRARTAVVRTRVAMRRITPAEIRRYVAGGEPMDKAGAYAVQGGARRFVAGIEGSFTNVVGLPLERLARLLGEEGLPVASPPPPVLDPPRAAAIVRRAGGRRPGAYPRERGKPGKERS